MTSTILEGKKFCNTALRVANIDRSTTFYVGVLGMKELQRMVMKDTILVFLGYPELTDVNTPLTRMEGVLELVSKKNANEDNDSHRSDSHFIKLAFHVSDLPDFMNRVKQQHIKVVKEAGTATVPEAVASFLDCEPADLQCDATLLEGLKEVCFVKDPDGYLIEIVPY